MKLSLKSYSFLKIYFKNGWKYIIYHITFLNPYQAIHGRIEFAAAVQWKDRKKYIYIKQIIRLKNWIESLVVLPG